jgi:hypothetical protein
MVKVANDGQLFWDFDSLDLISEAVKFYTAWNVLINLTDINYGNLDRSVVGSERYEYYFQKLIKFHDLRDFFYSRYCNVRSLLTSEEISQMYSIILKRCVERG